MTRDVGSSRRCFLRGAAAAGAGFAMPAIVHTAFAADGPTPSVRRRPQVAAIYCPLWHRYDHMDSWKGYGWSEWELLKKAPPRFPGHYQPLRPSWGFFDESDPKWVSREIDLAADHNIDVFLYDWYWYSGVRLMEEGLENGFLKAPNRSRIKFALMWANHNWGDYFPIPFDRPMHSWLPQRHWPADLARVVDYCADHYFRQPNYWTVEGRLFFSVFHADALISQLGGAGPLKTLLATLDKNLHKAGLPPIHWNAMTRNPKLVSQCRDAGFQSTTTYTINGKEKQPATPKLDYEEVIAAHTDLWKAMSDTALPHCPVVAMGWDVTPRCEHNVPWPFPKSHYPYTHVVVGNTPDRFGRLCKLAAEFVAADAKRPPAVFINAWNEWSEGSYLLPEQKHGDAYLKAVRQAFGA